MRICKKCKKNSHNAECKSTKLPDIEELVSIINQLQQKFNCMKTCLYHFRELQNDVIDYKQEIHEAEEKIEGFKERLRIQSPADLESLEDDINKFDIFTNSYSVFVQVYKTVFDFISSRHAEATFFNKNTF